LIRPGWPPAAVGVLVLVWPCCGIGFTALPGGPARLSYRGLGGTALLAPSGPLATAPPCFGASPVTGEASPFLAVALAVSDRPGREGPAIGTSLVLYLLPSPTRWMKSGPLGKRSPVGPRSATAQPPAWCPGSSP